MNPDIQIRGIGPPQRDLLIAMYDRFDPLGAALGLPPRTAEGRCEWIGNALGQKVNVAAFSPAGEVVGHCFLAADKSASAEMAVFVHQESRRIGVGTALVKAALDWGGEAGLRHVWSLTASEKAAALLSGRPAPVAFECGARGFHGAIDIGCPGVGRFGDDLLGRGIVNRKPLAGETLDKGARSAN